LSFLRTILQTSDRFAALPPFYVLYSITSPCMSGGVSMIDRAISKWARYVVPVGIRRQLKNMDQPNLSFLTVDML